MSLKINQVAFDYRDVFFVPGILNDLFNRPLPMAVLHHLRLKPFHQSLRMGILAYGRYTH